MSPESESPALSMRIAKADRRGLLALVRENLERLTEREVLQILRHPYAAGEVLEEILATRRFLTVRAVRRGLALHPATPRHAALRCLDDLTWRDLLDVSREVRTPPPVRRAAGLRLLDHLRRAAEGERIAMARFAPREVFPNLLADESARVAQAVLQNPRLTADDLVAFVTTGEPAPERLALIAAEGRFMERPAVRAAILGQRLTPRPVVLSLLTKASRAELERLAADPTVDALVAACARALLRGARPPEP